MSKSKKKGTVRMNVTLRCNHKTTIATEKQQILYILSVCL